MHPASYHTITTCLIVMSLVSFLNIFIVVSAFVCYDCASTELSCTTCVWNSWWDRSERLRLLSYGQDAILSGIT